MKCVAHLSGCSGELDRRLAARDLPNRETLAREPGRDRLNIRIRRAELAAEGIRCQPTVI